MQARDKVVVGVSTFAVGLWMGLSTGIAGAATGLQGYEGQPGHQAGGGSKVCAPGQHGNPQPGFKPGTCR